MSLIDISRVIGTCVTVLGAIFGVVAFCVIKFNDLAHIDKKLIDVDVKIDNHGKMISGLDSKISNIDGHIRGRQDESKSKN